MAFTGAVNLVAQLAALEIEGIEYSSMFAFMPDVINSNQIPMFYVRVATLQRETSTLGYTQGLRQGSFEAVVLVSEMLLGTQEGNIALAAELEDAITEALEANAAELGLDSYSITPEADTIGEDTPVWALVIRGEVSG